jgi:cytochrome b561
MSSPAKTAARFAWPSRVLHWLMAVMVLAMLLIGMAMVASLLDYHRLLSIHRPLGILVLVLVIVRFVNRQLKPPPPFPETMSPIERAAATWTERLLYVLMFLMPLIGWGMLSAARYPIVLFGSVHLPPILPHSARLYAVLRTSHAIFAYILFFAFMAHLSAVLFHTLVLRDGILRRMAPTPTTPKPQKPETRSPGAWHPAHR